MPDFATLLSEHIHNKNIKTYALAQYCNLDRSNMYKIIKGQRKPSSLEMVEKMCKFMHLSPSEQADMEESYHIALIGRENYYRRKAVQQFFEEFRIPTLQLPATSPSNASDYADNATLLHSHLEINRSLLYIILGTEKIRWKDQSAHPAGLHVSYEHSYSRWLCVLFCRHRSHYLPEQ